MDITIGTRHTVTRTVDETLTAAAVGSGTLPVFGTPFLGAMMEHAALLCLQPFLDEGQGSVGTRLDISHTAPTPVGMAVTAWAEIVSVSPNGRMVEFKVFAEDESGPIGDGTHTRAVISNEKFLAKCNAKGAK